MFSLVFQPGSMGSDSHRLFLYRLTLSVTFAKVCKISPQHCNCQFKRFNPQVEKNPSNTHTHTRRAELFTGLPVLLFHHGYAWDDWDISDLPEGFTHNSDPLPLPVLPLSQVISKTSNQRFSDTSGANWFAVLTGSSIRI